MHGADKFVADIGWTFVSPHTNLNAETTAYTRDTVLKSTGGGAPSHLFASCYHP
jgi:hypothetical protein